MWPATLRLQVDAGRTFQAVAQNVLETVDGRGDLGVHLLDLCRAPLTMLASLLLLSSRALALRFLASTLSFASRCLLLAVWVGLLPATRTHPNP
jgi:hypothetical protein